MRARKAHFQDLGSILPYFECRILRNTVFWTNGFWGGLQGWWYDMFTKVWGFCAHGGYAVSYDSISVCALFKTSCGFCCAACWDMSGLLAGGSVCGTIIWFYINWGFRHWEQQWAIIIKCLALKHEFGQPMELSPSGNSLLAFHALLKTWLLWWRLAVLVCDSFWGFIWCHWWVDSKCQYG